MAQFIMSSPTAFGIQYEINPFMYGRIDQTNRTRAAQQWAELRNTLIHIGGGVTVAPHGPEYCPDTVFIGDAGLVAGEQILISRFKNEERGAEEPFFHSYFVDEGFVVAEYDTPRVSREKLSFEGGDAIFNLATSILWLGVGQRTALEFKSCIEAFLEDETIVVRPLELIDSRFFSLSTCFCPTEKGELLWYPPAFSDYSQYTIELWYPKDRRIEISEADALALACDSISMDSHLVMPEVSAELVDILLARGYEVIQQDMSEFVQSGGGCKSLTLKLS